jgi:hypothetical protein
MYPSPSGHMLGRYPRLLMWVLVSFLALPWFHPVAGQNLTFRPPLVDRGGEQVSSVTFRSSETVTLRWEEATAGLSFRIGLEPGEYGYTSLRMRGTTSSQFTPEVVGLPVGVYYGVLTDSDETTYAAIQIEASGDPSIHYSREIRFAVETDQTARLLAPTGTITERVPTFEWEAVPGATAYALIVSSTPFLISSGARQITDIEGLNPVWVQVTTRTSVRYGEQPLSSALLQFSASPLVPGRTYYYTVLNTYSTSDPAFLSVRPGPSASFTLQNRGALPPATLTAPADASILTDLQEVVLTWDPLPGALSYDVSLFERLDQEGFSSDVQVFATNTSNTSLTVPARQVLRRGTYRWFVIANDREGAASVSATSSFRYRTAMGRFTLETRSAADGEELIGVTVSVRSTDGGYSPVNPFVNRSGAELTDSLSVGSYLFTASKVGYASVSVPVTIRSNELVHVPMNLAPLPSRFIGQVVDQENAPVQNADVVFTGVLSGERFQSLTSANGVFSVDVEPGTYTLDVTKAGYRPAARVTLSIAENQSVNLPDPFVIIDDEVSVSGRVINQDGIPVVQARITAVSGTQTLQTVSDGTGAWNLDLNEGSWSISAAKEGFLAPRPREFSLRAQDVRTNINFVLVQQASRIEGLVQGHRERPDGSQDIFPLAGATVTALPLAGPAATATTDDQGRFQLDLGTGAYAVSAQSTGFDPNGSLHFVLDANETIRDAVFRLEAWTSTAFGTVVTASGERVDGAVVRTSAGGQTTSSGGGAFSLPVSSRAQQVTATHPDYVRSDAILIAPQGHSQQTGLRLVLSPNASRLSGMVRTAMGTVPGVMVEARLGNDRFETVTGADGRFGFELPAGQWTLSIVSDRYRQAQSLVVDARSGSSISSLVLDAIPDYVVLSGFVSRGGQAVSGAQLDFVDLDESIGRPVTLRTLTASDGSWALVLGALTRYRLDITHAGSQPYTHTFTTPAAGQELVHDAALEPSQSILSGQIVRTSGGPVADATIEARVGTASLFATRSLFDGSFSLPVEAGSYQLYVRQTGFEDRNVPVEVGAGQQLTGLRLELAHRTGNLTAVVINPLGGAPIAGARLVLSGVVVRSAYSGSDGSLSLSALPIGAYQATVEAEGFQRGSRSVTISAQATASERFIMVPANGMLSGRVVEATSGTAIAGATIRLLSSTVDRRTTSAADGSYRFDGVPIGTYTLSAQRVGFGLAPSVTGTVTAATPTCVAADLRLPRTDGRIEGRVARAADDAPLSGVEVSAVSAQGAVSTSTRTDGTFTFSGLAAGSWTLAARQTGYRGEQRTVDVVQGGSTSAPLTLQANNGRLSGRVRSASGDALSFDVSVEIITLQEQFQTFTSAEGEFSFDGLPVGESFILRTRMQREQYVDVERTVTIPAFTGELDAGTLAVRFRDAEITGNVGAASASVSIRHAETGRSIALLTATSSGAFEMDNLEPGTYVVTPVRTGFSFSPASATVDLLSGEKVQVTFSASATLGIVQIAMLRSSGEGVPGIQVRIASLDRTVDQLLTSDANGLILPASLPLGLRYRVEPVSPGYRFDPVVRELDLVNQSQQTTTFTVADVASFLAGAVVDGAGTPIPGVRVVASRSVSEQFVTETDASGAWQLGPMPGGSYTITASRVGYLTQSRTLDIADNATVADVRFQLEAQSVQLTGRILQAGQPLAGLTVRLIRPLALETRTDGEGRYLFAAVPVESGQTTVAEIAIARPGRSDLTRTISYDAADVGNTLTLYDIALASGRISVQVTDGQTGIPNLRLDIQGPEGRVINVVTGADGRAQTPADLDPGTYLVSPVQSTWLSPPDAERLITIPDAEAQVETGLVLPFRHVPPAFIRSDEATRLVVSQPAGGSSGWTLQVEVAINGDAPVFIPFEADPSVAGVFQATLPIPGERPVVYQIRALGALGQVRYASEVIRFTPVVAGRLQSLVLLPDPHDNLLRTDTPYTVQLQVRDALGQDLTAEVRANGTVQWAAQSSGLDIQPFASTDGLGAVITPLQSGSHALSVTVRLGNEVRLSTAVFTAGAATIARLTISAPQSRVRNNGATVQLQASGLTAVGERVLLGDGVTWEVDTPGVAEISGEGRLRTLDERYVGPLTVVARDAASQQTDSLAFTVYAQLDGIAERFLTDHAGTEVLLPAGSVPFRSQVSLSYPRQPAPRQFDPAGKITASSRVVRLSLQADRSLLGDTLVVPATITLPFQAEESLFKGSPEIGHYDTSTRTWTAFASRTDASRVTTDAANRLGDFSVVNRSDGLRLDHVSALPTPFSPDIGLLKVGYFLETAYPPASVHVDILTLRGELVRRLVSGDMQWPGRYGSRSGVKEILWDGLTDDGRMARNGRYLIRIEAEDRTGRVEEIIPVVLVK